MKIAIGGDHSVLKIKESLIKSLKAENHEVLDCGTYDENSTHYPLFGFEVGRQVVLKHVDLGIVLCGTGIGIANAVNKVKGIRCVHAINEDVVVHARKFYDANVVACGVRTLEPEQIEKIVNSFIATKYLNKKKATIYLLNKKIKNKNWNNSLLDTDRA